MKQTPGRIPEGTAILDTETFNAEEYGIMMRRAIGGEYRKFAKNAASLIPRTGHADAIPPGARVLELGPGPGWAGIELLIARPDITLVAMELSPDMIRAARKNAEAEGVGTRAEYQEGSAEDLSRFPDASFDAVISRDSLHHWESPEAVFQSVSRVLAPGGRAYITDCKRNLAFAERALVWLVGLGLDADTRSGWKSSIAAAYTADELNGMFFRLKLAGWKATARFMDVEIVAR